MLYFSERVCEGESSPSPVCLDPSFQTFIVAEGSTLRISLGSEGLYPCADDNCDSDKIMMAHQNGPCTLEFNRDTARMKREDFRGTGTTCDELRTDSWAATVDDPDNPNDVYLKIESAHPDDRYLSLSSTFQIKLILLPCSGVWTVTASNEDTEGVLSENAEKVTATVQVWVAAGEKY